VEKCIPLEVDCTGPSVVCLAKLDQALWEDSFEYRTQCSHPLEVMRPFLKSCRFAHAALRVPLSKVNEIRREFAMT
jgi:hypothetical protein